MRYSAILLLVIVLCLSLITPVQALASQAPDTGQTGGVFATGLNNPTAEQASWMKKNLPVIKKIQLNDLALARINAERSSKGLKGYTPAESGVVPLGKEAVFGAAGETVTGTESSALSALLPEVDNSKSPAFPPIRSQGGIGSCVAWATTYYQLTYEQNLALGRTASGGDNNNIFSPKWTYDIINGGVDGGAFFSDAYSVEMKNGAANWATFPYDTDYLKWDLNPADWEQAFSYRPQTYGSIYNSNVDTMIGNIKTQLANGHILVIGTYVYSWATARVGTDPTPGADNTYAGQYIASYEKNTAQGGHAMTIVGYNDNIWCDLNGNGQVDSGEKGAFKIANSWGTGDWNGGYRWITYDSLRTTSAVPASGTWPTRDRASGGLFFSGTVYTLTVNSYAPTMKAEVTLNQTKRGQIAVTLGLGSLTSTVPTSTWTSKAVYNTGGNYAFNGTTTAVDGTFYFDFTDLAKLASGANRWFVGIKDGAAGDVTTIKSFNLYQGDTLVASASGLPKTIDAGQGYVWVDYSITGGNLPPAAVIAATPTSGQAPLVVTFDGLTSADSDGSISSYTWSFGDGATATGATASHTYTTPGQFVATLTVTDNQGATGSSTAVISAINIAPTASFSATPDSGSVPLTVSFDGSASGDSDGTVDSYAWSFGDGAVDTSGAIVSHSYSAAGTYTARLTVKDNWGATGTSSLVITVIDPNVVNSPSGLTAKVLQPKVVTLTWVDNSANETSFYIERGTKSKAGIVYARVAEVGAGTTTFTQISANGTYYYRVQAYNSATGKVSGYTNAVSIRVR